MALNNLLWRRPRHYMDVDDAHDHVHWVELFFDLIHVVTIFMDGHGQAYREVLAACRE